MQDEAIIRTAEQDAVVELVEQGETVAVQAGAGTGKTSTLVEVANSTDRIGFYVAFNNSIVRDAARKMPDTVIASTAHSLAMKAVGHHYRHRIGSERQMGWELARRLGVPALSVVVAGVKRKRIADSYLASLIMRTLRSFAASAEEKPTTRHVPYVPGIDLPDSAGRPTFENNERVREHVEPFLDRAWSDIVNPNGALPYTHDHYLKIWQLSHPRIPGEFILFDEAQDASPVMVSIIEEQDAQIVWVGDSQQQIYEWRGAVDALDHIAAEQRVYLTQSFRFGQPIADVANVALSKLRAELRLVGVAGHLSSVERIDTPEAILTRTNAAAIEAVLNALKAGQRPFLVGGGKDLLYFCMGAQRLMRGERAGHPDLGCFESWLEVLDYVENDPNGDDLALMVKIIEEYGVEVILDALDKQPRLSAGCAPIVSTAHKAKGLEWDSVQLGGDFPIDDVTAAEWRLIYVAATRARQRLDISKCFVLDAAVRASQQRAML